ncbi:MAG TPA: TlpA disulfide reductase family protein [Gemmatimonadales bacterium]|nr:TlpA disulfide reductase family protein [Gemmatimonadales bacterium]
MTVASGRGAAQDGIGLALGTTPPAVTIEDLDGRPVDLGQWVGKKPVLFEFWATWCPQCEALFPALERAHARFADRVDFVVIAVGVNQSPRSIRRHLERHPMPFTILWDGEGRAVRTFQAPTTSYVVVLDAAGKVVYTGAGAGQDVMAALGRAVAP